MRSRNWWASVPTLSLGLAGTLAFIVPACAGSPTCQDYGDCGDGTGAKAGSSGTGNNAGMAGDAAGAPATGGSSSGSSSGGNGASSGEPGGDAGSSGDAGAGGTAVSKPCDGACSGMTPVCDQPNDKCVECLKPADCAGTEKACDLDTNNCVECLSSQDCTGTKKVCDTAADTCVDCLASTDCKDAKAAKCDANACAKCTSNDDCTHIAGKTVCDTKAGECVQCNVTNESVCGGKSCNPATKTCTNTTVGSVGSCGACVADSECSGGGSADPTARCVPMQFNGTMRPGGYCLKRASKTCSRPLTVTFSTKSLSDAAAESYCGVDQTAVTCEAVTDMVASTSCADGLDTSCGCSRGGNGACLAPGVGGLCRTVGGVPKTCSVACGTANECISGKTCTIDDAYCH